MSIWKDSVNNDNTIKSNVISYDTGMTAWEDALSAEEIHRIKIPSGKKFRLSYLDLQLKDGGTDSDLSVSVYADLTEVGSTTAGTLLDVNSEATGDYIIVRLSNSSGGTLNASVSMRGSFI